MKLINAVRRTELLFFSLDIRGGISDEELVQQVNKMEQQTEEINCDVYCIGSRSVTCAFLKHTVVLKCFRL